ncbi:uncharacterized protein LOC130671701 [Microplitis mediator]|uniref:uncharacterized protein LOC130671701 n=1 Tax=Microplitis mediator TaxID=375433 RepID=UPI00255338B2|nr:uncharacterized protein LOC130671701 [Microplitis mediator]
MAEFEAKINMSLDEIIKLERKEKKKKLNVNGKPAMKKNIRANNVRGVGRARNAVGAGGNKSFTGNFKKNFKTGGSPNLNAKKRNQSQAWRLQRGRNANQPNSGFVTKRYKQQNGVIKRTKTGLGINKNINNKQQQQQINKRGLALRRTKNMRFGLTRSRSRNNLATAGVKNFSPNARVLKKTNSLPDLRNPNSVHNRLGYQSLNQVAYRNRVKRAKKLLLQLQNKQKRGDEQMVYRPAKALTALQRRALERRQQQLLSSQRIFNAGGLRSDQILRTQRRAQYAQKFMRLNAAQMNPNVNFMCTLGDDFNMNQRQMNFNQNPGRNLGNSNLRHMSRERSPFRPNMQNSIPRSQFMRPRSRSRSRSRSRVQTVSSIPAGANVDDRTFSQVMYSVSNNLGVTGRTLNDRFSF